MIEREKLDALGSAKEQIVRGSLTIWNERLAAMVQSGDLRAALAQMVSPIESWGDNCGCGNNCKCGGAAGIEALGEGPVERIR